MANKEDGDDKNDLAEENIFSLQRKLQTNKIIELKSSLSFKEIHTAPKYYLHQVPPQTFLLKGYPFSFPSSKLFFPQQINDTPPCISS